MTGLLVLLGAMLVWALLFIPFFHDRQRFIKSAKCAVTAGAYIFWAHRGEFETNLRYALRFDIWFILGCLAGYLVKYLVNYFDCF